MSEFDLIIIGGGPAGLCAGLYAARAKMNTILFDAKGVGGEIMNTDLIEDYPGFLTITGRELAGKMEEHATKFGLKIEIKGVKEIRSQGDRKVVELVDGTVHTAIAVIITTGGEPVKLGVPGEAELHGKGVSYCAVCDGAFFQDCDLAVIGGGDSAVQEGLFLTRFAKTLSVVHRRTEFRAQAILQERLFSMDKVTKVTPAVVKEIGGDGVVQWMDVERNGSLERVPVDGVFIFVGFKPLGRELFVDHINHDKDGYLITDENMRTNLPGVYAAGDCRAQLARQITTAVGDATTAVLHAERYIEELKHAEQAFPSAPKEVVAETTRNMNILTFTPGATVIKEGERPDMMFLIARGEAIVKQRDANGQEVVVNNLAPGDYFGEVGLLKDEPRNASVYAKTSLEVFTIDRAAFRTLVTKSQATADQIAVTAAGRGARA